MTLLVRTHYALAKESIRKNRTRSFLTCLGIGIGVASIILIMSLMGSINNMISSQVKAMGQDLIVIRPAKHVDMIGSIVEGLTNSNSYMTSSLTLKDSKVISGLNNIQASAPIAAGIATLTSEDRTVKSANVVGTNTDLMRMQNLQLKSGTFLSDKVENSAVVGRNLSLALFGTASEAIGQTFTLFNQKFIVVGMLEEMKDPINFSNVDFDSSMIVSADYIEKIGGNFQVQQINVKAANTDIVGTLSKEMNELLYSEKSGNLNYEILSGDQITHPAGSLFSLVSGMLTVVAGVSLIVGGIGVMNILLVSVGERTREIGIRKAVGASWFNIMMQFLFEAFILSLSGGMLGMILGYALAFLISIFTPFGVYIDLSIIIVTIATSLIIGLIFGIYPAVKAAKKNPIDSLRYYR